MIWWFSFFSFFVLYKIFYFNLKYLIKHNDYKHNCSWVLVKNSTLPSSVVVFLIFTVNYFYKGCSIFENLEMNIDIYTYIILFISHTLCYSGLIPGSVLRNHTQQNPDITWGAGSALNKVSTLPNILPPLSLNNNFCTVSK